MSPDGLRTIGVVVGAHGLQGTLKIEPLTDFPERFDSLDDIYLMRHDVVLDRYHVKRARWSNRHVLVTLREITTRTAADLLNGCELCVPIEDSWKLPEGSFFVSDLIGYVGVGDDGKVIGTLSRIHQGGQDLLEFEGASGSLMVPFVSAWVGSIDEEKRTIQILNWRQLVDAESIDPQSDDH